MKTCTICDKLRARNYVTYVITGYICFRCLGNSVYVRSFKDEDIKDSAKTYNLLKGD